MVLVYIWKNSLFGLKHCGHASVRILQNQGTKEEIETYISWWPEEAAHTSSPYQVHYPEPMDCLDDDLDAMGYCRDSNQINPLTGQYAIISKHTQNHLEIVPINGLDEEAMVQWWQGFALRKTTVKVRKYTVRGREEGVRSQHTAIAPGPLPRFEMSRHNCSVISSMALDAGGGARYASYTSRFFAGYWSPMRVLDYATSIREYFHPQQKFDAGRLFSLALHAMNV